LTTFVNPSIQVTKQSWGGDAKDMIVNRRDRALVLRWDGRYPMPNLARGADS
jgi:hypothetical protein